MSLKMEVYSPFLELFGVLEAHRSVVWSEKSFRAGSFSVDSLITSESKSLLIPHNIIWIEGDSAGQIEYIQERGGKDGPYITVKGPTLTGILRCGILWGRYDLKGTVPQIMHMLVNDCCISPTRGDTEARKIPGLVSLHPAEGGDIIRVQKTGGYLLDALEELGAAFGVTFGVRFNPAVPQMEFWTRWGQNRSINQDANEPVFYSTELDDVLSSEYSYNAQDWRNVALVAGEGEGDERVMITVESNGSVAPVPPTPGPTEYTITISVDPAEGGSAAGAGRYQAGDSVTLTATSASDYTFSGWKDGETVVSTETTYTFTASSDRSFTAVFAEKPASRLPAGYTEVEYIESKNQAGIDTGLKPFGTIKLSMDVEPTQEAESAIRNFFGSNYLPSSGTRYFFLGQWTTSGIKMASGSVASGGSAPVKTVSSDVTPRRMILTIDYLSSGSYAIGTVDSTTVNLSGKATSTSMRNIYLLSFSSGNSGISAKLYSCQIYDANTPVRDFVPCIDPTGAVGLYDLVGGRFYGNAGTGSFSAGPAA